ncbi:glycerophosphodiester phosphodiesterase family protein [Actinotalea fermentans]|uniref:Glycerophosphoryl diester phosphodiesterase n=1 Tax=Actinotalea fermentans TaxID=43671 RepID=A0A511YV89_9CELL|nr:glycerophosphodiester phosphodiesterase family protein [Actinotalea fermentans]KGM16802.1 glycerophosphodiester phosphodiesterase [Actinotalea fermentans ATCC 43279 = JCM 9966 = DSM 3133]GEN79118.1 glycerophosphoryl diester phosphodiesterase [Actinotalea fermentans]
MRTAYLDHPGPLPLAHRGFSAAEPENSMAAFAAAVALGFRYVETDVHATRDGVAVAFHDDTLDRVSDGTGRIADLPWSTVARARIAGTEPVPRLDDLLGTWPQLRVNIDVKSAHAIGPLVEAIERTRAHDRVCVASFSDARRRAVERALSRPVTTSAGTGTAARFRVAVATGRGRAVARALGAVDGLQVPERHQRVPVVTAATVAAAHAAGRFVHVWTVNEAADMVRLLDLGVDGIVSDRADVLRDVLAARGQWFGA